MDRVIRAAYRWDAEAMVAAHRAYREQQCRPIFRRALDVLFVIAALGGLALLYHEGPFLAGGALIVVGLGWPLTRPTWQRWAALRHFRTRTDQDSKIEWGFAEDEITNHSAIGSSTVRWEAFSRLAETADAFLLYMNDRIYYWIPKAAFDPEDLDDFARLARERIAFRPPAARV